MNKNIFDAIVKMDILPAITKTREEGQKEYAHDIENVFGAEPKDDYANNNNNTLDAKVNALITRVTALESKLNSSIEKKAPHDDEIPF